ncbi:hypothetical protein Q9189_004258 [Teloschistes chrysophthalmus]
MVDEGQTELGFRPAPGRPGETFYLRETALSQALSHLVPGPLDPAPDPELPPLEPDDDPDDEPDEEDPEELLPLLLLPPERPPPPPPPPPPLDPPPPRLFSSQVDTVPSKCSARGKLMSSVSGSALRRERALSRGTESDDASETTESTNAVVERSFISDDVVQGPR